MTPNDDRRVLIVGGGVIGVCCALMLQRDGHTVTIIERDEPGMGTTIASCGLIAVGEIVPLSKPGIFRKAPAWLLSPKGPMAIRPGVLPSLAPWLLRFMANSRPGRIRRIAAQLAALTWFARDDYDALLGELGLRALIHSQPVLEVFDHHSELESYRFCVEIQRRHGFDVRILSGAQAAEMEPALAGDFAGAALFNDWRAIVDSYRFVAALCDAFIAGGGCYLRGEVQGFEFKDQTVARVRLTGGDSMAAGQVIVAAGAWSRDLAALLGERLAVQAVAGYQTILPEPGIDLRHALLYGTGGFGLTPYESGISVAGTVEFSNLDAQPDFRRARIIVDKAKRVLPGLSTGQGIERVGWRPLTPDTVPVIGRSRRFSNVFFATGHGQLGVTLGATTGRLIAGLVAGRTPNIDLSAYRADRF